MRQPVRFIFFIQTYAFGSAGAAGVYGATGAAGAAGATGAAGVGATGATGAGAAGTAGGIGAANASATEGPSKVTAGASGTGASARAALRFFFLVRIMIRTAAPAPSTAAVCSGNSKRAAVITADITPMRIMLAEKRSLTRCCSPLDKAREHSSCEPIEKTLPNVIRKNTN